jgi:hypothetical protein
MFIPARLHAVFAFGPRLGTACVLAPTTIAPWCPAIQPPSAVPLSRAAASGSVMTRWHGHARKPVTVKNQPPIVRRMRVSSASWHSNSAC